MPQSFKNFAPIRVGLTTHPLPPSFTMISENHLDRGFHFRFAGAGGNGPPIGGNWSGGGDGMQFGRDKIDDKLCAHQT